MLSVKQGGIKNYFLSLWYDTRTQASRTIGEHSTHKTNEPVNIYIYLLYSFAKKLWIHISIFPLIFFPLIYSVTFNCAESFWMIYINSITVKWLANLSCSLLLNKKFDPHWVPLEKQRWTHKRCTLMDPHTRPRKSRTTSTNVHSAAMWGYRLLSWRPT